MSKKQVYQLGMEQQYAAYVLLWNEGNHIKYCEYEEI